MPNQATSDAPLMALAIQPHAGMAGGAFDVPEWIHLVPGGDLVEGRDGRAFRIEDPDAIIEATEFPMQLDVDHESVSWFGGSTKAYGWIDRVEYVAADEDDGRAAGFWGHVETWTQEGRDLVAGRVFRGISPVVRIQFTEPSEGEDEELHEHPLMVGLINAALTNRPNLRMTLLNSQEPNPKEASMAKNQDELERTRAELAEAKAEVEAARKAEAAKLTEMREELAKMKAEKVRIEAEQFAMKVDTALDEHRRGGTMEPFGRDFFAKAARGETTLEDVEAYLSARQPLVTPGRDPKDPEPDPAGKVTSLNAEQKAAAKALNLSDEEYLAALNDSEEV